MKANYQAIISQMFEYCGFEHADIVINLNEAEQSILVDVQVPRQEAGLLIGYQGEKIDSFRRLLNLMINNDDKTYVPLQLNVNDYRQQREELLHNLADEAAQKAIESQKEILLPPLSSYERRLIHMRLSGNDQVTTYSEGEGAGRRLVVQPKIVE